MTSPKAGSRSVSSEHAGTRRAKLTLASVSPRRLALLAQIGIVPDDIRPTDIDETPRRAESPRLYAQRVAREKADAAHLPGRFTLSADTVVALGQRILPKAADGHGVETCLNLLSGRRHHVLTAIVLVSPDGKRTERLVDSVVGFARLTPAQIASYVAGGEGEGKAGGYAIQGHAGAFVRFLSGSYSGVVGLPLFETAQLLRGQGWPIP